MRNPFTKRISLAATAVVVAAVAAVYFVSGAEGASVSSLDWKPCQDNDKADCASVTVPIDWSKRQSGTVDVAVARREATDPKHRIGTLVYVPAGPGSSGVEAITDDEFFTMLITSPIAERFDVIGLDPRGVKRSHPVTCAKDLVDKVDAVVPPTREGYDARLKGNAALMDDCRDRTGPLFDHLDSVSVAKDIEALRSALGEESVNLYALSYGTLPAQMYAEQFPDRLRGTVLDSNMDHSLNTKDVMVTGAEATQDAFDDLVSWCRDDEECSLHGKDVRAMLADLYAKAEAGDLTEPGDADTPVTVANLISGIVSPLAVTDRGKAADRIAALTTGKGKAAPTEQADGEVMPLPITMQCADFPRGIADYDAFRDAWDASEKAAPDVHFSPLNWSVPQNCLNWDAGADNPRHRLDVRGAEPVLVLGSRFDTQTPYSWSANVASQIDGAVLATYEGPGHGVYQRTDCTRRLVERYLIRGETPRDGVSCPAA
ncbi:alpha/beta hydrolase [Stackebrandtia nassauensis]|uniref:TAP domain protein n=1 Tax=Stackebrandtia nassauensis (strain DSM 44728 / CIP 108903 / NRRL B-16338 / NBRC 102104 / LLR-40K-21) TaxID=446470 RepID=D3Q3A2_STANL|nr:alpha/beta hydrolase [Stackebrandtia nassauensis]ADD41943.1 TAP domain protein [Stackebrandtia nassauensis DSM 44728]